MNEVYLAREVRQEMVREAKKIHFETGFNFLKAHRSWRKGETHLFIGGSGVGKSTLFRSLLSDFCERNDQNPMLVMSEEESSKFYKDGEEASLHQEIFDRTTVSSLYDTHQDEHDPDVIFNYIEAVIEDNKISILFLDNLTTLKCYKVYNMRSQEKCVTRIKKIASKYNIPVVIFAHTDGKFRSGNKKLLSHNDIRGCKDICNQSEFIYMLDDIRVDDPENLKTYRYTFVMIDKYRSQNVSNTFFKFIYNGVNRKYTGDTPMSFHDFKELYNKANSL